MAHTNYFETVQEGEPSTIVVGDYLQWKRTDLARVYDPASYTLSYIARIAGGGNEINITASSESDHYLIQVASATTATYNPGEYHWQLEISRNSDGERLVIERGHSEIVPDLDNNNSDPRSHAEIMLGKIESLLSGKADSDVSNYAIQGRSLTKMNLTELIEARGIYQHLVSAERAKLDAQSHRATNATVKVRF